MHNSIQNQALKIRELEDGVIPSYDWGQKDVSQSVNGCYTINPRLLYESVMLWLEKCQDKPPYETIEYTYMLEVIDASSDLYKEIAAIQINKG